MRTTDATKLLERLADQGHLIGEVWRSSSAGGIHRHHYAATGRHQADVRMGGRGDVNEAVAAAVAAQPGWAATAPVERARVLFRLADLLEGADQQIAELGALDNGSPVSVMRPGANTAAWLRYYAGWCDKLDGNVVPAADGLSYVRLEPFGVIAAIPPWNGSMVGMGQKCGPALAAGNAVVAKPPELSPFGMLRFAELALEAGLPPGVLNVVVGGAKTGDVLVRHPDIAKISFTGGRATARKLMASAAENLTPLALELGGSSANIIFPDADLGAAAGIAATFGTALLSGQGCAVPTRLYVHDEVYDEVVAKVLGVLSSLQVGDPLDPATFLGPMVTETAAKAIMGVIRRARTDGATLLAGGERLDGDLADGWFVAPTVFGDVDHASDLARTEVFGPVQAVLRFSSEEEVLAKANDSDLGLGAYLHTRDSGRIVRMSAALQAGTVVVNGRGGISPATPFGGCQQSGFGREGGRAGIEEFVRRRTVFVGSG